MVNKIIRGIALTAGLGQYLSDWNKSDPPEVTLTEIKESEGQYEWPDGIEVWNIFDAYAGLRLAELIEDFASARVNEYLEVADAIKGHIVTLATEDLMPQDQNELDLRGWVNTGFGREMEGDRVTEYVVGSSHGEIWVNKWGFVITKSLHCKCNGKDCIDQIEWFDLAEYQTFWGEDSLQDIQGFDILDLGGRNFDGTEFPPDPAFRKDALEGIKEGQ